MAENLTFIFIPIIFLSLNKLKKEKYKEFYIWFIIGFSGMFYSHLVLSMYFIIFLLFYILCNYKIYLKKENLICLIKSSIIVIIICLPFLINVIENGFSGLYQMSTSEMASVELMKANSMKLSDYFKFKLSSSNIVIYTDIFLILLFGYALLKKNKYKKEMLFFTIPAFFMTLSFFQIGRASCMERVCQLVYIAFLDVYFYNHYIGCDRW